MLKKELKVYSDRMIKFRHSPKIKTFDIPKMWGIGTPEDLDYFLKNYNGEI